MIPLTWSTSENLGTFPELLAVSVAVGVVPPPGTFGIVYVFQNGEFPSADNGGVTFTLDSLTGSIGGVPGRVSKDITYEFTIRAIAFGSFPSGVGLGERTFSMTITGSTAPSFVTPAGDLYSPPLQDSTWNPFQIEIDNPDPGTTAVISIINGSLPPGLEMNNTGLIQGYADPPVTPLNLPTTTSYPFTLKVETESGIAYRDYQITVINQELNPGYSGRAPAIFNTRPPSFIIPVSNENYGYYLPSNGFMGAFSQENNLMFKIIGNDWADEPLEFSSGGILPNNLQTNFIYNDTNVSINIPVAGGGTNYNVGDVLKILGTDIGGLSPNHDITFTVLAVETINGPLLTINPLSLVGVNCNSSGNFLNVPIQTVTGTGAGAIANVNKLGADWITGTFDASSLLVDTYTFDFTATNPQTGLSSDTITFSLTVTSETNNVPISLDVTWITDSDLGTIYNGNISTFAVQATSAAELPLTYEIIQIIATDTTAGTNEITCDDTTFLIVDQPIVFSGTTFGNIVAGTTYYVLSIVDSTTFTVSDTMGGTEFALSTASGSMYLSQDLPVNLTLNEYGEIVGRLAFQFDPVEEKSVGFNQTFYIAVRAYNVDYPEISSTKVFNFTAYVKFNVPYDNLYIKALLSQSDRGKLTSLLQNNQLIPKEYLYRPSDPYFGLAQDVIYQHMFGVPAVDTQSYIAALVRNHYWRYLVLGPLQTAQARDTNNNVIYEVVYSEVIDNLVNDQGISIVKQFNWPTLIDNTAVTVYPNSLINMRKQIANTIPSSTAFPLVNKINTDSSILPLWMTSQQENGSIIGFKAAWVICYTLPGYSTQIKQNIEQNWVYKLNELTFEIDRLEIDRSFSFDVEDIGPPVVYATLPSGTVSNNEYDKYIYYPQKNILY